MNIEILQPQPFDLVGQKILIAGNAVAFEGTLTIKVSDGHDEVSAIGMAGGVSIQQFQASVDIPPSAAFTLDRLFVTVSDEGGSDEGPVASVTVPVLFGPKILPNYAGYWEHTVVPGDTLTSIAQRYYEGSSDFAPIQAANQHIVTNPNLIFVGQVLRIPMV